MSEKLKFDLDVGTNNLKAALNEALNQVKKFEGEKGIKTITKDFDEASNKAKDFGLAASVAIGGLLAKAALTALSAVKEFAAGSLNAYAEQEDAINKLNGALESSGRFTKKASEDLQEFASTLQNTTRFSDDAALGSLALLESLTRLDSEGLQRTTKGAADLAARFGKDLPQVVETLGRAFNGQTKGLKEFGITFKDTGDKAQNFEGIMALVEKRFSGAAQKDLQTYSGKVALFKNQLNDFQEVVGGAVIESGVLQYAMERISNAALYAAAGIASLKKTFSTSQSESDKYKDGVAELSEKLVELIDHEQRLLVLRTNGNTANENIIKNNQAQQAAITQEIKNKQILIKALEEEELKKSNVARADEVIAKMKAGTLNTSGPGADPVDQSEVEKKRASEAEITAIKQQGLTARRDAQIESDILDIEDSNLKAQAEIDFAYLKAEEQANAKLLAKQNENTLLATKDEEALANKKAMAEKELAITQATVTRENAIKKQKIALDKEISAAQGQLAIDALSLGMALSKQGSSSYKTFANAQAIMSTYLAANKAMAEVPYPANIAAVASTIAVGLANVAKINSIQAFEQGGIVPGTSMSGDRVMARVNSGELILNKAQQDNVASQLGSGGNAPIIIQIDGRNIAYAIRDQVQAGFKLS